jgi:hypothetical protein
VTGCEEQVLAVTSRVNGEDTSWPLVGLVITVCASVGITVMASAMQAQERFRIDFIENSFEREIGAA